MTDYEIMWNVLKQEIFDRQNKVVEDREEHYISDFNPTLSDRIKMVLSYVLAIFYLFGIAGAGIFFIWQIAIGNFNYFYLFMIPACIALVWLMVPYRRKREKGSLLDKKEYAAVYDEIKQACNQAHVPTPGEIRLLEKFHFEVIPRPFSAASLQLGGALFAILDHQELAALVVREMRRYQLTKKVDGAFIRSALRSMQSFGETLFDLLPDGHRHRYLNPGTVNKGAAIAAMNGGHSSTDTMSVVGANAALAVGYVIFFPVYRFARYIVFSMLSASWRIKYAAVYESDRFCAGIYGNTLAQNLIKKVYTPTTYLRSIAGYKFEELEHLYEMKDRYNEMIPNEIDNSLREMEQNLYRKDFHSPHELERLEHLKNGFSKENNIFGGVPAIYGGVKDIEHEVFRHIARGALKIRTRGF